MRERSFNFVSRETNMKVENVSNVFSIQQMENEETYSDTDLPITQDFPPSSDDDIPSPDLRSPLPDTLTPPSPDTLIIPSPDTQILPSPDLRSPFYLPSPDLRSPKEIFDVEKFIHETIERLEKE